MWLGALATIIYTFLGGFLAVSWTDTIQATLMIFALLLTPLMVIFAVGGLDSAVTLINNKDPAYLDMFKGLNFVAIISLLGWGLGYFGQPHILARFMAADSAQTINRARHISMTWMILCLAGTIAVGFFGIAYFDLHPAIAGAVIANPERIFMELATILFNPWLAGILLSAILAAVMSTLSCQLLVCASALTEDLYKPFIRPKASQRELVWIGRAMVLVVAAMAIFIARDPNNKVLVLVSNALAGMLVGALTVLIWMQYKWFGLYEIIPGFIFASIAIVIVSLLTIAPSQNAVKRFVKAEAEYKACQ